MIRSTLRLGGALTLLALAACSPAADGNAEDPALETKAAESAVSSPSAPAATSDVTAERMTTIPSAYLGVWDFIDGNCNPDSDLRLKIAPDALTYYESYGEVQSLDVVGDAITVTMSMEGEGETWESRETFRLVDNGTILESNLPAPGGDGNLRRKKCEG